MHRLSNKEDACPSSRNAIAGPFARSAPFARRLPASLPKAATFRALTSRRSPSVPALRAARFILHYRDIPDFINKSRTAWLAEDPVSALSSSLQLSCLISITISMSSSRRPVRLSCCVILAANRDLIGALLGPGGDQAFIKRIIDTAREAVVPRAQTGILGLALGTFFDYYVTYVVSAEVGMIQRWFERGLTESPEAMARIMTVLAFVRPGDLYGQPIDINVPEYGMKLLNLQLEDAADTAATVGSNN